MRFDKVYERERAVKIVAGSVLYFLPTLHV